MQQQTNEGVRVSRAPDLDARAWLSAWADNGGIALLAGDRLFVSRLPDIDRSAAQRLNDLRSWLYRPGAGNALAGVLSGLASLYEEGEA